MRREAALRAGRDRGFALLIVLWTLGLLSLIATQILASGRSETQLAANIRSNALAEAAADGAVNQSVLRLMQGAWRPDGTPHVLRIAAAVVEVRMEDEARKINPNFAPPAVMAALLRTIGLDPARATSLAAAIADWRTRSVEPLPGGAKAAQYRAAGLPYGPALRPFENLDELGLVLGMRPDILARLKPLLSVYGDNSVRRSAADPLGEQASEDARTGGDVAEEDPSDRPDVTATVRAAAAGPGGARFTRQAVVRIKADPNGSLDAFQILTWETPEG